MTIPGWDNQTVPGSPRGWIQWKGTQVCMSLDCTCGTQTHFDTDFCYYVQCSNKKCQKVYMVNGHVEMVELTSEETIEATKNWGPKRGTKSL